MKPSSLSRAVATELKAGGFSKSGPFWVRLVRSGWYVIVETRVRELEEGVLTFFLECGMFSSEIEALLTPTSNPDGAEALRPRDVLTSHIVATLDEIRPDGSIGLGAAIRKINTAGEDGRLIRREIREEIREKLASFAEKNDDFRSVLSRHDFRLGTGTARMSAMPAIAASILVGDWENAKSTIVQFDRPGTHPKVKLIFQRLRNEIEARAAAEKP